jgi:hypothetical protein
MDDWCLIGVVVDKIGANEYLWSGFRL